MTIASEQEKEKRATRNEQVLDPSLGTRYQVYHDSLKAVYGSWSATDQLYIAVCSVLLTATTFLAGWAQPTYSRYAISSVGLIALLLATTWVFHILRYQKIVKRKLELLQNTETDCNSPFQFFTKEKKGNYARLDFAAPSVVILMSLVIIALVMFSSSGTSTGLSEPCSIPAKAKNSNLP